MPPNRAPTPQPWSKLQRENTELLAAVARDGLTMTHAAEAQRLAIEAQASGTITPDFDARTVLREIIRYWTALLSLLDDAPVLDLSLSRFDPAAASSDAAPDPRARRRKATRELRDAISSRRALSDVVLRDAALEASETKPLAAYDLSLVNCRLVGGAWRHVELHGDRRELKETSFFSVTFERVIADRVKAADTLWEGVAFSHCHLEDGADFESCVIRIDFKAEATSFKDASFRKAKLVPSVEAQTDRQRATFDLNQPAPLIFRQCDLSNVSFDRAVLSGVLFDGCDLRGARFHNAVLDGVDFGNSQLQGADFQRVELMPHFTAVSGAFDEALMDDTIRELIRPSA